MKLMIASLLLCIFSSANTQTMSQQQYVKKYAEWAMAEMERVGIPASITLAQGILESGNGNSKLATKANNHFGIKCHSDWKGPSMRKDDDKRNECFRKYKSAYESFKDHSAFLQKSRYAFLFELKPDDYKGWAKGLKKAGYATNPKYPSLLIDLIEKNKLYEYDKLVLKGERKSKSDNNRTIPEQIVAKDEESAPSAQNLPHLATEESFLIDHPGRKVHQNNRVDYIIAKKGDTFYSIAKEFNLMLWQLYDYNDLDKDAVLSIKQVVYVQAKKKRADRKYPTHVLRQNESLHDISQLYGIKLSRLYALNGLKKGDALNKGEVVNMRKKKVRF